MQTVTPLSPKHGNGREREPICSLLPQTGRHPHPYSAWAHLGVELGDVRSPLREVEKLGGGKGRDGEQAPVLALALLKFCPHMSTRGVPSNTHADQQELNYRFSG